MANNIKVSELIGEVDKLNKSLAETATRIKDIIESQKTASKELNTVKGLTDTNKKLNTVKQTQNQIEQEGAKLLRQRNSLVAKQDQTLKALTKDTIKQQEALKEQNKQLREQARAELGLKKRDSLFKSMTKSILAAGAAMLSFNTALNIGKKILNVVFLGTQSQVDTLRIKMAGLKSQFEVLTDRASMFGETLTKSLENGNTKGAKLFKMLKLLNPAYWIGQGGEAAFKALFSDTADEMEREGKMAQELEKRLIEIEKKEANINALNSARRRDVAFMRLAAEDESNELTDRIKLLQDAQDKQKQIEDSQVQILKDRIAVKLVMEDISDELLRQLATGGVTLDQVGLSITKEKERAEVMNMIAQAYDAQTTSLMGQRRLVNEIITLQKEQRAENDKFADKLKETPKKNIDSVLGSPDELTIKAREVTKEILDAVNATVDTSPVTFWDKLLTLPEEKLQETISQFQDLGNVLFDIGGAQRERELSEIQNNYQARIAAAEGNTELQKKLAKELEQEQKRINRESAIAERNNALFNVAMNTAVAVSKAWGQTGIFGVAAQIPILAMGALQAAAILSRPLPGFFKGTENAPAGLAWVAEHGAELIQAKDGSSYLAKEKQLVNLQGGEKIKTASETTKLLNSAIMNDIAVNGNSGIESRLDAMVNKMDKLKQVNVNFDENGMSIYAVQGKSVTKYLNSKGRK